MIQLITDSTSDLSPERARALGVQVLPLTVHFGAESFRDGLDITHADFYARLRGAQTLPTTSQINPDEFVSAFQPVLERGDQVVGIFLSSELSGTYQSACIARDMLGAKDIYVLDSRTVTFPLGLLITMAAGLRDKGVGAAELVGEIAALQKRMRVYAVLDTLKYLKMGGRISAATAAVGGMLGISPIIAIENGKVESVGKARGRKAGIQWIVDKTAQERPDASLPIAFGHSDCPEAMAAICEAFAGLSGDVPQALTSDIGAVVGTYAGPGATGIAYFTM